ncbi:MAG: hypothetical protein E6L09_01325 [Verrucomicrobia bacterium]|nr:MAG: hypothetical protein E6L09_01325 [Verrucomicrobiota bacterium]
MSLVEMLIATGLGTVLMTAIISLMIFAARSFVAVGNYVDLDVKSRNALDRISQEIRQAAGLQSYSTSQLIFTNDDLTTLTYTYDSAGKKLTRSQGGATQVLLTQCDSLNWYMYQRNMTNGTDEPIPTSDKNQCKLIKLTWVCSRTILGKRANTESVQSAEIVIRKK